MRVGSLFSGIGGLELGLERAGMTVAWQVENDDYCTRVLARHWPDVARFRDVRECHGAAAHVADAGQQHGAAWPEGGAHQPERPSGDVAGCCLPPVDLICGGFPCQPVSHAGQRKGADDARWLWPEFARIVREVQPRWVVVENVPGLLSIDDGRLFRGILWDLSESGYDAEWDCIPASSVGAPHIRDRVFIVAHATGADAGSGAEQQQGQEPADGKPPQLLPDASGRGAAAARGDVADAAPVRRGRWPHDEGEGQAERDGAAAGGVRGADTERRDRRAGLFGQGWWPQPQDSGEWSAQCRLGIAAHGLYGGLDCGGWECGVTRVMTGQTDRVARLRGLGNAVVPAVAEHIGRLIMASEEGEA